MIHPGSSILSSGETSPVHSRSRMTRVHFSPTMDPRRGVMSPDRGRRWGGTEKQTDDMYFRSMSTDLAGIGSRSRNREDELQRRRLYPDSLDGISDVMLDGPWSGVRNPSLEQISADDLEEPLCDIVFVHGVSGHPEETWTFYSGTQKSGDVFWPKDLLAQDFPRARMFSFGYKADSSWDEPSMIQSVSYILLSHVASRRTRGNAITPVIWVAHSLGGLFVKAALVRSQREVEPSLASIWDCTAGILFLGTPHHTMSGLGFSTILRNVTAAASPTSSDGYGPNNVGELPADSMVLWEPLSSFDNNLDGSQIMIYSFYETRPSLGAHGPVMITRAENALGHSCERIRYLEGTHHSMCKFQGRDDPSYISASLAIHEILARPQNYSLGRATSREQPQLSQDLRMALPEEPDVHELVNNGTPTDSHTGKTTVSLPSSSKVSIVKRYLRFSILSSKHVPQPCFNTVQWIVDDLVYKTWQHGGNCLLITGPRGCGKSTVMSFLVKQLQSEIHQDGRGLGQQYVLHFFFSKQLGVPKADEALLSQFLLQLIEVNDLLVRHFGDDVIHKIHKWTTAQVAAAMRPPLDNDDPKKARKDDSHAFWGKNLTNMSSDSDNQPEGPAPLNASDLSFILNQILRDSEVSRCYILIDGLDECTQETQSAIRKAVRHLKSSKKTRICLTYPSDHGNLDNLEDLNGFLDKPPVLCLPACDPFPIGLKSFIKMKMDDPFLKRLPDTTFGSIRQELEKGRTFLWVSLATRIFGALTDLRSMNYFLAMLRHTRESEESEGCVKNLYRWLISYIHAKQNPLAVLALYIVAFAPNPLRVSELASYLALAQSFFASSLTKMLQPEAFGWILRHPYKRLPGPNLQDFPHPVSVDSGNPIADVGDLEEQQHLGITTWLENELHGILCVQKNLVTLVHLSLQDFISDLCNCETSISWDSTSLPPGMEESSGDPMAQFFPRLFETVNFVMAKSCIFLVQLRDATDGSDDEMPIALYAPNSKQFKLCRYALANWGLHTRDAGPLAPGLIDDVYAMWQLFSSRGQEQWLFDKGGRRYPIESQTSLDKESLLASFDLYEHLEKEIPRYEYAQALPLALQVAAMNSALASIRTWQRCSVIDLAKATTNGMSIMDFAAQSEDERFFKELSGDKTIVSDEVAAALYATTQPEQGNWGPGGNALVSAAMQGRLEHVQLALDSILSTDSQAVQVALEEAVRTESTPIVDIVLRFLAGAAAEMMESWDIKLGPSIRLAARKCNIEIAELLLKSGRVDCNDPDENGQSALHIAAEGGEPSLVRLLLKSNGWRKQADNRGQTALHAAAKWGHAEVCKMLLSPSITGDKKRRTPLYLACRAKSQATVTVLVKYGMSISMADEEGRTPLHVASERGAWQIVEYLIWRGAEVNVRSSADVTPLHEAARHGWTSIVRELTRSGAEVDVKDKDGMTPLHHACHSRGTDVSLVSTLLESGANASVIDAQGRLSLHYAATCGNAAIIPLLLAHSSVRTVDGDGKTALDYARHAPEKVRAQVVRLLESADPVPEKFNVVIRDEGSR